MTKIIIENNSGDKDFFTILPNYIANHSTANDQALYFQMKRYAGEDGKCFATEKTLMGKLGIGKKAYNKSLSYLISKDWISYIGITKGKTRPIKTYKINNIWKLNNQEYNKISAKSTLSTDINKSEISSESEGDKFQKQHKISAESTIEEEQYKEEPLIRTIAEVNSAISSFSLKEEIKKLEDNPRRDLNIIAFYATQRNPNIETKGQFRVFISRHLRAAKEVKEFSDEQIISAAKKCKEKYKDIDWTIETIKKVLTK